MLTLPQGHVRMPALGQSPQGPSWQIRSHAQRPQPSVFPHTRPHRNSRSLHRLISLTAPHGHEYSPAGGSEASCLSLTKPERDRSHHKASTRELAPDPVSGLR